MKLLFAIVVSIVAGFLLVNPVSKVAKQAVFQFNLSQISEVLSMHYVTDGKYPQNLEGLVENGELSNINPGEYTYHVSEDGQQAVLGAKDTNYCWSSNSSFSYRCR